MAGTRYYTLVASLPRLLHFERLERLPINRQRLDQRLAGLSPAHQAELRTAEGLVEWQRQPAGRSDAEIVESYRETMPSVHTRELADFVAFRMDVRTVMAALRRRERGEGPPPAEEPWGVPSRTAWLRAHWEAPDFDLSGHYPWLDEARRLLHERAGRDLQRLQMDVIWRRLGHVADARPFGFEAVFGFVFRWDIANRWLSYQAEAAVDRFRELVTEAMGEHH